MTATLETLVIAGYVFADEARSPRPSGRPPEVTDAELIALAVCQAITELRRIGSSSASFRDCCRGGFRACPISPSTTAGCAL